jgi:Rrf2 family protein
MLALSTKGRYATRILVFMANSGKAVSKPEISSAEEISTHYIEQILIKLKTAGLVRSFRGPKGGFSLARNADSITVSEVLAATEGPVCLAPCIGDTCGRQLRCATKLVWQKATEALNAAFSETTIGKIAKNAANIGICAGWAYEI